MLKLLIGLALWSLAHVFKRMAPGLRRDLSASIGDKPSRGLISLVLLGSVVLMFLGYRQASFIAIYSPWPAIGYVTDILMLPALFLAGIGSAGGRLSAKIRHPLLISVILWAFAHLLVNGDLASILLFGGLGLWAGVQILLINGHEGPWERPMPGNALQDWKLALASLFLFVVISGIHWLFNHNPFLGTYP